MCQQKDYVVFSQDTDFKRLLIGGNGEGEIKGKQSGQILFLKLTKNVSHAILGTSYIPPVKIKVEAR